MVDVGLFHHRQELPGVGGQRFHLAPLTFRVQRVEGERRLPGSGQAGDHDQLVAWDRQVEILEIVGTRAAQADVVQWGRARG